MRKYNPNPPVPEFSTARWRPNWTPWPARRLEGFARWSLRLLEEKVVELNIVEKASDNTIGRTLKNTLQAPSQSAMGDSTRRRAAFVAAMEDVLEPTKSRVDLDRPLVCLDETSKQLIVDAQKPIPPSRGNGPVRLRVRA